MLESDLYLKKLKVIQSNFHLKRQSDDAKMIFDIEEMKKAIIPPLKLISENFTKLEQKKILQEVDYFVKDPTFKALLPTNSTFKLLDLLENEEKQERNKTKGYKRMHKLDFRTVKKRTKLFKFFKNLGVFENEAIERKKSRINIETKEIKANIREKYKKIEKQHDLKIQNELLKARLTKKKEVWNSVEKHRKAMKKTKLFKASKKSLVLREDTVEQIKKTEKVFRNLKSTSVKKNREYSLTRTTRIRNRKDLL